MSKSIALSHRIPGLIRYATPVQWIDTLDDGDIVPARLKGVVVSAEPALLVVASPAPGGATVHASHGLDLDHWEVDLRERAGAARAAQYIEERWHLLNVGSAHDLATAMGKPYDPNSPYYGAYVGAGQGDDLTSAEQSALREIVLWVAEVTKGQSVRGR